VPPRSAPPYFLDCLAPRYDALLVANGTPPPRPLLARLRDRCERLVALDGGLNVLHRYGMAPGHVVGDLDSATPAALAWARQQGARIHKRPAVDEPDFVKGLKLCASLGCHRLLGAGVVGGRLDHVLGAVYSALTVRGVQIDFATDEVAVFPLRGRVRRALHLPPGHTLSWFAIPSAGPCSLTGVRWPFTNRKLDAQGFYSLSNQPLADSPIVLTQQAGRSVVILSLFPQASR
jgi:thiamine pyrophosphokinase